VAGRYGGGISTPDGMYITSNTIAYNKAQYGGGISGGGRSDDAFPNETGVPAGDTSTTFDFPVAPHFDTTITLNLITGNYATMDGGGLYELTAFRHTYKDRHFPNDNNFSTTKEEYWIKGEVWIEDNMITSNTALRYGGGLYNCSGVEWERLQVHSKCWEKEWDWLKPRIKRNFIVFNHAGADGGAAYDCDIMDMWNCVISSNTAENLGAGLMNFGQPYNILLHPCGAPWPELYIYELTTINNCTIWGNKQKGVGGAGIRGGGAFIRNCIIWGNIAPVTPGDVFQRQFADSIPVPTYSTIEGWSGGGIGNLATEPDVINPDVFDFRLIPESNLIDAGGSAFAYGSWNPFRPGEPVLDDIRGEYRPYIDGTDDTRQRGSGSDYDIGAYEYHHPLPLITGLVMLYTQEPIEGVILATTDGLSTATTDINGYYELPVPYEWTGTVMPELGGWTFIPASRSYPILDNSRHAYRVPDSDQIRVDRQNYWAVPPGPPENDDWGNAIEITAADGQTAGWNVNATLQDGEPVHAAVGAGNSVWWVWTAPSNGNMAIDTVGSTFNTVLAVHTGDSVATLTEVVSNDNLSLLSNKSRVSFRARAGVTYYIAVDGRGPSPNVWGGIRLTWSFLRAPSNDDFAMALPITSQDGSTDGTNMLAGREPGEPEHAGTANARASVWWVYNATGNGTLVVDTSGSRIDTVMAVYTGSSVDSLAEIVSNNNALEGKTYSRVTIPVDPGVTYYIAIDGLNEADTGTIRLNWRFFSAPVNDDFVDAITLTGENDSISGWNTGATTELNEPDHAGAAAGLSVWYTWTAPSTGFGVIETRGSVFNTVLGIYSGNDLSALGAVASNDDANNFSAYSRVIFNAQAGQTYRIAVDGSVANGVDTFGDFVLSWRVMTPPPNDDFRNAAAIFGASGQTSGWNVGATREVDEPIHASYLAEHSAWWVWTAPADGGMIITTDGSTYDTVLAVYTGTSLGSLVKIAENDESTRVGDGQSWSEVLFEVAAGVEYYIAVDGFSGNDTGDIVLNWERFEIPTNDDFAMAVAIADGAGMTTGWNRGFSLEPGEPSHADGTAQRSAWWRYDAAQTGKLSINTFGSSFDTVLGVYTGESVDALKSLGANNNNNGSDKSLVRVGVFAGESYYIAVDGFEPGDRGLIVLNWDLILTPPNDDFDYATTITGVWGESVGLNYLATLEPGEPVHDGAEGESSVWYLWEAEGGGLLHLDTEGSTFDTVLAAYTGDAVDALTLFEANNDADGGLWSTLDFNVQAGQTYRIAIDSRNQDETGTVTLNYHLFMPPANDNFATAQPLPGTQGSAPGHNVGASRESGEPMHAHGTGNRSVWYSYQTPSNGLLEINTRGSNFDTVLGVYTGDFVQALTEQVSNDDVSQIEQTAGNWSKVYVLVSEGMTYRIAVDGIYPDTTGEITLSYNLQSAPEHDRFATAKAISSDTGSETVSNLTASVEAGEPNHVNGNGNASLWWSWTSPMSGKVVFHTSRSQIDTVLAAYTGNTFAGLVTVAADDDGGDGTRSQITFDAVAGQTYKVVVDGKNGARGLVRLDWFLFQAPQNDDLAKALTLLGATGSLKTTNQLATHELGEPIHCDRCGENSIWWKWTAPVTGRITIDTAGSDFDTVLAVYTGSVMD